VTVSPALFFVNEPLLMVGTPVDCMVLPVAADVNNEGVLTGVGSSWTVPGESLGGSPGFVDAFVPVDGIDGVDGVDGLETTTGVGVM
jgi:hypothetical protein